MSHACLRTSRLFTLFAAVACALQLGAGEAQTAAPDVANAEALEQAGNVAMQASNNDHTRIVEAAIDFTTALKQFEALNRLDKVQELHANIFWCKKRMTDDDLNAYLAQKGHDAVLSQTVERMNAIAAEVVPVSEVDEYFARAKTFADEHPADLMSITIRWFEVAERFPGTKPGVEAQKLSLESQKAWMKSEQASIEQKVAERVKEVRRETLFTKPPAAGRKDLAAVPADADWKKQTAQVKKLFKDEPRATKRQKDALAVKIAEQAKGTGDDTTLQYAMFQESESLAAEAYDVALVVSIVDEVAQRFGQGYSRLGEAQKLLAKMTSNEAANAVLKLLQDPIDPPANTKAGKYWCLIAQQWDLGLPMLANGDDDKLVKLANMEIEKPDGAMQQAELGDGWYLQAKTASRPMKDYELDRARFWYKKCEKAITGASKQRVGDRLEEIFALRPDPDADYNDLNEKQWDALKGQVVIVEAVRNQVDAHMPLKPNQKVRVVPHPSDSWQGQNFFLEGDSNKPPTYTWRGEDDGFSRPAPPTGKDGKDGNGKDGKDGKDGKKQGGVSIFRHRSFAMMSLVCWVGDNKGDGGTKQIPGVLEGPGKLWLGCSSPDMAIGGKLRVKILTLDEGGD